MFTNEIEWEETITTVMDDSGKHEDLMTNSKLYKNFYEKQIQK